MNKQDFLKTKTCVLRVNIDCECDGCKHKVKKILQKVDGVYATSIDVDQGKVTVTGNADPSILIHRLAKSGKHAELWAPPTPMDSNLINDTQFKNINTAFGKGKKGGKSQKTPQQILAAKGSKDLNLPHLKEMKLPKKDQNSSKFNDDDRVDGYDDDDDGLGGGDFGIPNKLPNKMIPMKGNNSKGPLGSNDAINSPLLIGPKVGDKNGNNAKKGALFGLLFKLKGLGSHKVGKGDKGGGKSGGDLLEEGKKDGGKGGGKGKSGKKFNIWGMKRGGKNDGAHMMNNVQDGFNYSDLDQKGMGNNTWGKMGNYPTVQGLPAAVVNGGYYPEMVGGNPYNQQRMAMMTNHPRPNGNDTLQPMMYERPPLPMSYCHSPPLSYGHSPPLWPPPSAADNFTHIFSEENATGCNIM